MNDEYKYLEVTVIKKSYSTVFLKVKKDFVWNTVRNKCALLGKAAKETCDRFDWDDFGWEDDVEYNEIKLVDEQEALQYKVYEVKDV